ncbi:MAG: nucleoside monophosphate kinase [Candidatus Aenigmarchaeota archaeon]|nr:nucleoside monophosphate kinase [Candidatus Aenigmarchaeota archaeon]
MNLLFFGPPSSGKGTYASGVSPILGIPKISTGDIFRAEIAAGSKLGKSVEKYLKAGELVPDDVTINVIKERLKQKDCKNGFILDGFPRTIEQMKALEKIARIDSVLFFQWPEGVLEKKAIARRTCEKCGKIYNIADIKIGKYRFPPVAPKKPGICDDCGGKLIQRKDDTLETVRERMRVYDAQSKPLIKYYKEKGIFKVVDVIGPPEIMFPIIVDTIKKNMK